MKRLKKLKFMFIIALVLIYFFLINMNPYFSPKNFMNHIETLTSPEYKGRLTGDTGNKKAIKYIESQFKKLGVSPLSKDGFIQKFSLNTIKLSGSCTFKAFDARGNLHKEYTYGKDFKEVGFGKAVKGSVKGKVSDKIDDKNSIYIFKNEMLGESKNDYKLDSILYENNIKAAIYTTNSDLRFRTPYKLQQEYKEGISKIMVTPEISKEIETLSKTGVTFEITTNTENKKVQGENIVGLIKGSDASKPPIILSTHFDHVGFDSDGSIYPGALDNASGTSFLIETARLLTKSNPKNNIIIAAFDAEEVGLLGSKYFAENPPINIKNAKVINFDMVGSIKNIPLSILSSTDNHLSNELAKIMDKQKISYNKILNTNSDHASFDPFGVNAVTLIHNDSDKIHSLYDTPKNISDEKIINVFHTLKSFLTYNSIIGDKSFNIHKNLSTIDFYSNYILLSFITLVFLNGLLFIRRKG